MCEAGHAFIELTCIDWRELASESDRWQERLSHKEGIVRIESPGRDPSILIQLLRLGEAFLNREHCVPPTSIEGWIIPPAMVHAGLKVCFDRLEKALRSHPNLTLEATPADILAAFDKNETSERLSKAGVPVPEFFAPSHVSELLDRNPSNDQNNAWPSMFVKLCHGSCASGIVNLTWSEENRAGVSGSSTAVPSVNGLTTMARRGPHFFNSYELQTLSHEKLEEALQFLIEQGATAQRTVPRPMTGDRQWDLRIVVLHAEPIAVIPRLSRLPMTNLHLGGQRGDVEACRASVGRRAWLDALDCASAAAMQFELPCAGIDVAIDRHTGRPYVLEVNAFGDFFPNWTDAEGRSVHHRELLHLFSHASTRRTGNRD